MTHHPPVFVMENVKGILSSRVNGEAIFDKILGNHSVRSHIRQDLFRYLSASCYAKARKTFPRIADFPNHLRPAHRNVEDAADGKVFTDRFRVQMGDKPSTTVVSHISKDGHYFIHPDLTQCRSLTVREAARSDSFLDGYRFHRPQKGQTKTPVSRQSVCVV